MKIVHISTLLKMMRLPIERKAQINQNANKLLWIWRSTISSRKCLRMKSNYKISCSISGNLWKNMCLGLFKRHLNIALINTKCQIGNTFSQDTLPTSRSRVSSMYVIRNRTRKIEVAIFWEMKSSWPNFSIR